MANPRLITFYVAYVVEPIVEGSNRIMRALDLPIVWTKEMIDARLKEIAETDKSKIVMSNEELQEVIIEGFKLGDELGLTLDYPPDELDGMIDLNI